MRYEVDGWGVGEMWLEGELLLYHEPPRPGRRARERVDASITLSPKSAGDASCRVGVRAYFGGEAARFLDVELDLDGVRAFERARDRGAAAGACGETVTYGELAALAGRPNAQRAAGTFCARNRFGIVVPCHRVVAADGLGSYGSLGVGYKRRLLELEGAAV